MDLNTNIDSDGALQWEGSRKYSCNYRILKRMPTEDANRNIQHITKNLRRRIRPFDRLCIYVSKTRIKRKEKGLGLR